MTQCVYGALKLIIVVVFLVAGCDAGYEDSTRVCTAYHHKHTGTAYHHKHTNAPYNHYHCKKKDNT